VIGDALLGTAVVACDADGRVQCMVPAASPAEQLLGQQHSLAAAASPATALDDPEMVHTSACFK
jgi:hypothetical protein